MADAKYKVEIRWTTPGNETRYLSFLGTLSAARSEYDDLVARGREHITMYLDGKLWRTTTYDNGLRAYLDFLAPMSYVARYQREHGREWPVGPKTFAGRRGPQKQCYMNSARRVAFDNNPDGLRYVEGYVLAFGIPIDHAFLVDADGVVVEPTIRLKRDQVARYYGVVIETPDLVRKLARTAEYGPVLPELLIEWGKPS